MKREKQKITLLILVIIFTLMSSISGFAATRTAKITAFKGEVNIMKVGGEKTFAAFAGMSLGQGDRIITGNNASATLEIDDDKEVTLGENTQLNLSELEGSLVKKDTQTGIGLFVGKLFANVKNALNIREKFEVKTPTTVMGVKGTQFFVGQEDGRTDVAVLDGTVSATTYIPPQESQEGGSTTPVEIVLTQNQQVTLDPEVISQQDPQTQVQEVTQQSLDLFVLETIQENPEGIDQNLLQGIDQVIEQRQEEQAQQEQQEQQEQQQEQNEPPAIIMDPEVTAPPPPPGQEGTTETQTQSSSGDSGGYYTPPVITEVSNITTAGVTGFIAPVTGATPQFVGGLTAGATTYAVTSLTWVPANNPYAAATAYTATVVLTSAEGNKFPAAGIAAPTANGGGTVSAGVTAGGDVSGNILTFTVQFPVTAAVPEENQPPEDNQPPEEPQPEEPQPVVENYVDAFAYYNHLFVKTSFQNASTIVLKIYEDTEEGKTLLDTYAVTSTDGDEMKMQYWKNLFDSYMISDLVNGNTNLSYEIIVDGDTVSPYTGSIPMVQVLSAQHGATLDISGHIYDADHYQVVIEGSSNGTPVFSTDLQTLNDNVISQTISSNDLADISFISESSYDVVVYIMQDENNYFGIKLGTIENSDGIVYTPLDQPEIFQEAFYNVGT